MQIRLRSCGAHEQNCDASVEPLELDATQTAKVSTHLSSLGSEVCMLLRNTTTAMRELAPTLNGTYLLRYEDLAPPFTGATFAALWDTMGLGDATPRGFDPVATADKVSFFLVIRLHTHTHTENSFLFLTVFPSIH